LQVKLKLLRFVTRLFTKPAIQSSAEIKRKGKSNQQTVAVLPIGIRSAYSLEDTFMRIFTQKFWPTFIKSGTTLPGWVRKKKCNLISASSKAFAPFWEAERKDGFTSFTLEDKKTLDQKLQLQKEASMSPQELADHKTLRQAAVDMSEAAAQSQQSVTDASVDAKEVASVEAVAAGTLHSLSGSQTGSLPATSSSSSSSVSPSSSSGSSAIGETEGTDQKRSKTTAAAKAAKKKQYRLITARKKVVKWWQSLQKYDVSPSSFGALYNDVWSFSTVCQDLNWTGIAWRTLTKQEAVDKLNLIKFFFRGESFDVSADHIREVINSAAEFHRETNKVIDDQKFCSLEAPTVEFYIDKDSGWLALPDYCIRGIARRPGIHEVPVLSEVSSPQSPADQSFHSNSDEDHEDDESDDGSFICDYCQCKDVAQHQRCKMDRIFRMPRFDITETMSASMEAGPESTFDKDWEWQEKWLLKKADLLGRMQANLTNSVVLQEHQDHKRDHITDVKTMGHILFEQNLLLQRVAAGRRDALQWQDWGTTAAQKKEEQEEAERQFAIADEIAASTQRATERKKDAKQQVKDAKQTQKKKKQQAAKQQAKAAADAANKAQKQRARAERKARKAKHDADRLAEKKAAALKKAADKEALAKARADRDAGRQRKKQKVVK
jgi:hypothetical protein